MLGSSRFLFGFSLVLTASHLHFELLRQGSEFMSENKKKEVLMNLEIGLAVVSILAGTLQLVLFSCEIAQILLCCYHTL